MTSPMPTGGPWRWPPKGWIAWRRGQPRIDPVLPTERVVLTPRRQEEMHDVFERLGNRFVWRSDPEQYGKRDLWAKVRPAGAFVYGDCEDYAISARDELMQLHGWPASALRLCFCVLPESEAQANGGGRGHVVLTLELEVGREDVTFVFDSIRPKRVQDWQAYGWRFANQGHWREPHGRWWSREVPGRFWWERVQPPN